MIILSERVRGLLCSEARHGQGLQTPFGLILYMIILPERVRGLLCSEARHGQGLQTPFGHGAPVQCYFVSCLYLRA
jgi:hypothetical protein